MDELLTFAARAGATLLIVVDPVGVAPMFAVLTRSLSPSDRRITLRRAVFIAFGVTLFFLLAGNYLLRELGVTVPAFAISGGILLFATALPMLFGQRGALQSPEPGESSRATEDLAVFPLGIPLLSGPGTITTMLLLSTEAGADTVRVAILIPTLVLVFFVSWVVLFFAERLIDWVGQGKIHIITRVLGIVLAALAVQYVLDGVRGYYHSFP